MFKVNKLFTYSFVSLTIWFSTHNNVKAQIFDKTLLATTTATRTMLLKQWYSNRSDSKDIDNLELLDFNGVRLIYTPIDLYKKRAGEFFYNGFIMAESLVWINPNVPIDSKLIISVTGINGISMIDSRGIQGTLGAIHLAKYYNSHLLIANIYGYNVRATEQQIISGQIKEESREFLVDNFSAYTKKTDYKAKVVFNLLSILEEQSKVKFKEFVLQGSSFGGFVIGNFYRLDYAQTLLNKTSIVMLVCPFIVRRAPILPNNGLDTKTIYMYSNKDDILNSQTYIAATILSKSYLPLVKDPLITEYNQIVQREISELNSQGYNCVALNIGNHTHSATIRLIDIRPDIVKQLIDLSYVLYGGSSDKLWSEKT